MTVNPLEQYPGLRQKLYVAQFLVGLVLGAVQVGFASADAGQPTWLTVALGVFAFLVAGLGITAAQNVPSYRDVVEGDAPVPDELGVVTLRDVLTVALIVLVVVVIVALV